MRDERTTRRTLLKQAGIGCLVACGSSIALAAADRIEPMKVNKIDVVTFRKDLHIGGGSGGSESAEFFWVSINSRTL